MFQWIWLNKEWIFSGVGVSIVLLTAGFVYRILDRGKTKSSAPSASAAIQDRFTRPTPADIYKQINSLPPFQQNSAGDIYKGVEVCWHALFRSVSPSGDSWTVILDSADSKIPRHAGSFLCEGVEIEKNPRLKIAYKDERLIVSGTIAKVDPVIHLRDATIEFV
jgi:hypothetical protein